MGARSRDTGTFDLFSDETPVDAGGYRLDWPEPSRDPLNPPRDGVLRAVSFRGRRVRGGPGSIA
jgi:hypothetical protein